MQISELLLNSLSLSGSKPLLTWENGSISYLQLYRSAVYNANKLKQQGVQLNERVLLVADNGPEFLVGYFALQFIGAIPAPVNPTWKAEEIKKACSLIGAKLILTHSGHFTQIQGKIPGIPILPIETTEEKGLSFSIVPRTPNDPAQIRFTSGTTGEFKGVLLSQKNLTWRFSNPGTHYRHEDLFLCPIAFPFRILKLMTVIGMGAGMVSMRHFSLKSLRQNLLNHNISWLWASPAICNTMTTGLERERLQGLRGVSSLGAYLPPKIQQEFQDKFGVNIYQQYGLSEGMEAIENPGDRPSVPGSAGTPCDGVNLMIDSYAEDIGEVIFSGPNVMLGYITCPHDIDNLIAESKFLSEQNRVLKTGDLGRIDQNGYLYITGRKKRIINVDGQKVSPLEIEDALYEFPGVYLVKVMGIKDSVRGEVPVAYVVSKPGYTLNKSMLRKHSMEILSSYKIPKEIYLVEELPVLSNGKIS